jgi:DNA polymerase III delta prime subunit
MTFTFINKYRPYFIRDFYLDPQHNNVFKTLIEIDDINILLVGNSCSGKTSLINAIIREYYGFSETSVFPEHNIMVINNLKEQGIQFYRNELKTFCQSQSSVHGKKKTIIVDDIDNINEQSQQVFRNCIDKYSKNIQFLSVCSNIQKVNESLQSRLHIIKIMPATRAHLETTMNKIIEKEGLIIDESSRQFLLNISNNSLRSIINHLEKIYIYGKPVNMELTSKLCSNISFHQFEKYVDFLRDGKLHAALSILYEIHDYGYSVIDILDYFFTFIKYTDQISETEKYNIMPFLCKYITIFHKVHEDIIELAFFTNNLSKVFHVREKQYKIVESKCIANPV